MSDHVLRGLHLELVQGDDYLAVDQRAVQLRGAGVCWPINITNAKLLVYEPDNGCHAGAVAGALAPSAVLDIDGLYLAPSAGSAAVVSFDVPRGESLKLSPGVRRYQFEARALLSSGSVVTLALGVVTVLRSAL